MFYYLSHITDKTGHLKFWKCCSDAVPYKASLRDCEPQTIVCTSLQLNIRICKMIEVRLYKLGICFSFTSVIQRVPNALSACSQVYIPYWEEFHVRDKNHFLVASMREWIWEKLKAQTFCWVLFTIWFRCMKAMLWSFDSFSPIPRLYSYLYMYIHALPRNERSRTLFTCDL